MEQTHLDPVTHLNEAISRRGKSTHNGVYLTNLTIVAEAEFDYGYKAFPPSPDPCKVGKLESHFDEYDWLQLLVSLRAQKIEFPEQILRGSSVFQFVPEGSRLSMNVFIPVVLSESFPWEVNFSQDLLRRVCDFVGKVPSHIRFSIGFAHRSWGDMVLNHEVQEMDLNF